MPSVRTMVVATLLTFLGHLWPMSSQNDQTEGTGHAGDKEPPVPMIKAVRPWDLVMDVRQRTNFKRPGNTSE
jgi:hypothetical protein